MLNYIIILKPSLIQEKWVVDKNFARQYIECTEIYKQAIPSRTLLFWKVYIIPEISPLFASEAISIFWTLRKKFEQRKQMNNDSGCPYQMLQKEIVLS